VIRKGKYFAVETGKFFIMCIVDGRERDSAADRVTPRAHKRQRIADHTIGRQLLVVVDLI
jgi:hypothetical protein